MHSIAYGIGEIFELVSSNFNIHSDWTV